MTAAAANLSSVMAESCKAAGTRWIFRGSLTSDQISSWRGCAWVWQKEPPRRRRRAEGRVDVTTVGGRRVTTPNGPMPTVSQGATQIVDEPVAPTAEPRRLSGGDQ